MPIHGTHDPTLVALSYFVATIASFGALTLAERVHQAHGTARIAWLAGGALTMGLGIWGMHFVGMLAFTLPVPIAWDSGIVAVSVVPAVVASGLALWVVGGRSIGSVTYAWGSLAMGAGIVGMHYVGMAAMRADVTIGYRPAWVAASVAIAVLASLAALWLAFRLRAEGSLLRQGARLGAAALMGAAIAGMHYTGMAAAVFTTTAPIAEGAPVFGPPPDLVLGVSGGVVFIVFLALALAFLERRSPQASLFQLGVLMIVVPLSVGAATMVVLYQAVVDHDTQYLEDVTWGQARVVAELARLQARATGLTGADAVYQEGLAASLSEAFVTDDAGIGRFALAHVTADSVSLIFESGGSTPFDVGLISEPMRTALGGRPNSLIDRAPDGTRWVAVYEGVPELDLAVVSRTPLPELRGPFIRTALISASVALALVLAGLGLFVRVGSPLVERAEEGAFLESVLEHAPASWLVEHPRKGILRVNRTFEETFSVPANAVEGKHRHELRVGPALVALFNEMEQEARLTGDAVREFDFPTGDGRLVPVRGTVGVAGGLSSGSLFWVLEDITDRRAARDGLIESRQRAEEASRAKSAFLASMSHEIRTPMNGVMGMLELLLDSELTDEQRDIADTANSSADALLELLNSILDFSKIEAGALELESIPFDLERTVYDAVRVLQVEAGESGDELTVDIDETVPRVAMGDPVRLRQIVTNLVSNAIKFTDEGDVRVTLRSEPPVDERMRITLEVADTGSGIPADKLETIFGEFEQADSSTTRLHGGTGLGLAISRRLAHLMDGDISVRSDVGVGTTFTVELRLGAPDDQNTGLRASPVRSLDGCRFLIVDDNATARAISSAALVGAGGSVDEAPSAMDGLDLLLAAKRAGRPYDAAIIDSMMPDLDGFDLAARVSAHEEIAGTRMLMLTSAAETSGHRKARDYGIKGYLAKPVRRADLVLAVSSLLGLRGPGEGEERRVITASSLATQRPSLKVLLAEDSPVNRRVAVSMLEKRGHTVETVVNGKEAVEAVARDDYDLILMDVQMPEMDGIQATRAIRATERGADLPIVALTAHALDDERKRCAEAGMTDFLTKPYRSEQLYAVVEGWHADVATPSAKPRESPGPPVVEAPAEKGSHPVDIEGLRQSLAESGIEEILAPTLQAYAEETPTRLAELEAALAAGDLGAVARAAHAMKSASGTIHAEGLAAVLAELERAGAARKAGDVARLSSTVIAGAHAVLAQIEHFLAGDDR
jgi:PAS domain S-box-containing protein